MPRPHPLLLIAWLGCGGNTLGYEYVVSDAGPSLGADGHLDAGRDVSASGGFSGSDAAGIAGEAGGESDASDGEASNADASDGEASDGEANDADASDADASNADASDANDADASNADASDANDADASNADANDANDADDHPCLVPPDCPTPPNPCVVATCVRGLCGVRYLDAGPVHILDTPADCHAATACDGLGNAVSMVDQSNAPTPSNPCLAGTCDIAGTPGTEPLPARTPCSSYPKPMMCDGAGRCVGCLRGSDCPDGQSCDKSHSCVALSCTDVDCGGVCLPCALGKKCINDFDCASGACDTVTLTCIADRCADHRRDGNESDVDCGGPCARCQLGQGCTYGDECASQACDGQSRVCVADPCADHAQDGTETDVDCGGSNACPRCPKDSRCMTNSDCQLGTTCGFRTCQ